MGQESYDRAITVSHLHQFGWAAVEVSDWQEAEAQIAARHFDDSVIADDHLAEGAGLDVLVN